MIENVEQKISAMDIGELRYTLWSVVRCDAPATMSREECEDALRYICWVVNLPTI